MSGYQNDSFSPLARKGVNSAKASSLPATIFLALVLASLCFAAEVPKTEADIPIFPGAVPNKAAEVERMDQEGGPGAPSMGMPGLVFKDKSLHVFTATSTVEEVFSFYLQKLGGKETASGEPPTANPLELEPGDSTQMGYRIELYETGKPMRPKQIS